MLKKKKNPAKACIETVTWLKSRALYRVRYDGGGDMYTLQNNAYIVIFITKVEISTTGRRTIFRHTNIRISTEP
jgi:hypothetical protein